MHPPRFDRFSIVLPVPPHWFTVFANNIHVHVLLCVLRWLRAGDMGVYVRVCPAYISGVVQDR